MKKILYYFLPKYKTIQKYQCQFRVSFPLSDGSYRETGTINVTVPASNEREAKKKLVKYAKSKIKITVVAIE